MPANDERQTFGEQVIAWIEATCRVPEGVAIGEPVKLLLWQRDAIIAIYDNPRGTRRCIISVGRKSGKTATAAFLLLAHLCGPVAIPNSQLYSTAQSKDQASLLHALASKIVKMSPRLRDAVICRDGSSKQLSCPAKGTTYRALSAESATAFGLSPSFVVHDELGLNVGPCSELFEALESATGAQIAALSTIISTQSASDNDLFSLLIDDALGDHDAHTVCLLFTAPLISIRSTLQQ